MAKVMQCDRCKEIYELYSDEYACNQVAVGYSEVDDVFEVDEVYDLCPQCLEEFKIFIKSGKNESKLKGMEGLL